MTLSCTLCETHLTLDCLCLVLVVPEPCTEPVQLLGRQRRTQLLCDVLEGQLVLVLDSDESYSLAKVLELIPGINQLNVMCHEPLLCLCTAAEPARLHCVNRATAGSTAGWKNQAAYMIEYLNPDRQSGTQHAWCRLQRVCLKAQQGCVV